MKTVREDIRIAAPVERVWLTLTQLSDYPEWNPFIRKASGQIVEGTHLSLHLKIPDGPPMWIRPRLVTVVPEQEIRWRGSLGLPGVFDGDHRFLLAPDGANGTHLIQEETFSGALAPMLGWVIAGGARKGFQAMNRALVQRLRTE